MYISHRLDEIHQIGDRVTVLEDGRTVATPARPSTPTAEVVTVMTGRSGAHSLPQRTATVTYSPSMASSAIKLARLLAHNQGMSDLVERDVPKLIIRSSATITKDNVANYISTAFKF